MKFIFHYLIWRLKVLIDFDLFNQFFEYTFLAQILKSHLNK
jgi:hypothetical protein